MTREEAIEILEDVVEWSDFEGYWPEKQEKALRFAIAALRGPAWVRTSERVPDGERTVLVLGDDMDTLDLKDASELREDEESRREWPCWMPLPPLPEEKP